jgi:hypothetical protein
MRFSQHLREAVKSQIQSMAQSMAEWDVHPRIDAVEQAAIRSHLGCFEHTTRLEGQVFSAVDGSGDFPMLAYADSFVYLAIAQAVRYEAVGSKLREVGPEAPPVFDVCWLPEHEQRRKVQLDEAFARLAGDSLEAVVAHSDYRQLKGHHSGREPTVAEAIADLIRPHASDAGNLGIQLRSCAELGAARRLIANAQPGEIVLLDGTLSLPFVQRAKGALFHEYLKRSCCVMARARGVTLAWVSKSHGLPGVGLIEQIAKDRGLADHWFLRLPTPSDSWQLSVLDGRNIPPQGAVSYLWRTHRGMPVFRVDVDAACWAKSILNPDGEKQVQERESSLFSALDFAGHDIRTRAYPYPLKAAHDRASLKETERLALRKQVIAAAVASGMKASAFVDPSRLTGHA